MDSPATKPHDDSQPTVRPIPAAQAPHRMGWGRRALLVVLVAALVALVAASLRPKPEPPMTVQLATARRGPITRRVTAAGKLEAATTVKVSANISGDLVELAVKEGDRVKKGQLIARIEAQRYVAGVRQQEALRAAAAAELAASRVNVDRLAQDLERVQRLAKNENASQAELQRAESDLHAEQARADAARQRLAQAEASLADSRHLLSFATVVAPIDGVVVSRQKQQGERVRGSDLSEDPIVTIATLAAMEAKVEVGEHEVVYLHDGDPAEVEVDAFPDRKFPATVVEVAKNALVKNAGTEAEVTTFPVRLALTQAPPGALPGMSCQASISTETRQDALVVPVQAVTVRTRRELEGKPPRAGAPAPATGATPAAQTAASKEATRKVVFVAEGGVAKVRTVETGLASEDDIEIVSGLKAGEKVVEGPYKALSRELKDGKPVKEATPGDAKAGATP